jgi:hypothetical protein
LDDTITLKIVDAWVNGGKKTEMGECYSSRTPWFLTLRLLLKVCRAAENEKKFPEWPIFIIMFHRKACHELLNASIPNEKNIHT